MICSTIMTNFLISAIQDVLIVIVFLLPCCVRSMNNHSLFAFTHIDKKSPDNIEDSCLTINNSTPGTLYFGISLFINNANKNAICPSKNVGLKNIRKDIIRDKHDRPLCRTTLTVSINSRQCERTVGDLNFLCEKKKTQSIYFRECKEVSYGENETNKDEERAISMSALPAPVIGNHGPVYNIPKVQCRLNPDASDSLTTKRQDTTTVNIKDKESQQRYPLFAVMGSCLAGLVGGVIITSLICIFMKKRKDSRIMNNAMFPDSIVNLRTGMERKFSIHSKEEGVIYHDISDIPGPSKEKVRILKGVNNAPFYEDSPEQRYSESPKSSTSAYENESLSSPASSKNVKIQTKESSISIQCSKEYHTLAKDYDIASTRKRKEKYSATGSSVQQISEYEDSVPSSSDNKQCVEKIGDNFRGAEKGPRTDTREDVNLERLRNSTEALQSTYHVLQEKEEELQADSESVDTIIIEQITVNNRLEKESDINDGDSQNEYFVIEASNEREKEKREPI